MRKGIAAALFLVAACSSTSGLITSLEDITTEVDRQGLADVNQTRILSIAGLLAPQQPGEVFRFKSHRATSTAIGLTTSPSYYSIATVDVPTTGAPALLQTLRDAMLDAREKGAAAVAARISLASARTAHEAAPADATATTALAAAQTSATTTRQLFDSAISTAMKQVVPGMLVMRWATDSSVDGSLQLGDMLSLSGSSAKQTSGFALLYGVRVSMLHVGNDIQNVKTGQTLQWHWFEPTFPWIYAPVMDEDARITTHTLQAKNVVWFQDVTLATRIAAHLKASSEQLGNLAKTLSELDRIEVNLILGSIQSLGNMGSMSGIKRTRGPNIVGAALPPVDDWQTVYYVDTHLEDLRNLYK